jgi:hypothetical protein
MYNLWEKWAEASRASTRQEQSDDLLSSKPIEEHVALHMQIPSRKRPLFYNEGDGNDDMINENCKQINSLPFTLPPANDLLTVTNDALPMPALQRNGKCEMESGKLSPPSKLCCSSSGNFVKTWSKKDLISSPRKTELSVRIRRTDKELI